MRIEVWSDYVCPFCYIGKRNLELALKQTGMDQEVEVIFKSFELDPNSKKQYDKNINQLMAAKYRMTLEQAIKANNRIIRAAKEVGLEYNFDNLKPTNTFDAHRLSHLAESKGKLNEFTEIMMHGYFTESLNISDFEVLLSIAEKIGLDREEAAAVLKSSEYTEDVRKEESDAYNRNIGGVPYFLFDGKDAISGAQPVETLVQIIKRIK